MKIYIQTFLIIGCWIGSLFIAVSITESQCEREFILRKTMAFKEGILKGKKAISKAPNILNSLIATDSLGIDVIDTYFAKGTILRNYLYDVAQSEGLKRNYFCPNVYVSIDGNNQGVNVSMSMARDAYLDVSFSCYNVYNEDIFVRDSIICFSKTNYFVSGTKYEDISIWIERELRSLCSEIKEKKKLIIDEIKKMKQKNPIYN